MNFRKLTASLTAMACSAGMFAYFPAFLEKTYAAELVYNDFEVNYGGWYGNADTVTLTAENGTGCDGSRGMVVSGRTNVADGASAAKGFYHCRWCGIYVSYAGL